MALTYHDDISMQRGDDWTINGQLLDAGGNPLDITNAEFEWALVGPDGNGVVVAEAAVNITPSPTPTDGKITVAVNRAVSEGLVVGRYFDALRVFIGDDMETYWKGQILVCADPFSV